MQKAAFVILRLGTGITFVWIGILVLQSPAVWGGLMREWAVTLLPISAEQAMISTGVLDLVLGVMFLADALLWVAGAVASVHLAVILAVTGVTDVTVRDIGLLASTVAIGVQAWMQRGKPTEQNRAEGSQQQMQ